MINDDADADHESKGSDFHFLAVQIQQDKDLISRLIALNERMMKSLEDHQDRITRLEYALARKEKKVSRIPGDRES